VEWIYGHGLQDYYRLRCEGAGPGRGGAGDFSLYDRPAVLRYYARSLPDGRSEITLGIEGLRCAACTWLIERALGAVPAVTHVQVHPLTQRVTLRWRTGEVALSELAARLAALGYRPHLADPARAHERIREERRAALKRLVIAGVGMMQAMMYAVALYAGAFAGMDPAVRDFFRWVSMAVAAPVLFYAGQPFFRGAFKEWRARRLGMDTPVTIALLMAFCASVYESARGGHEVYFDSVTMFVFFLLLGRYAEQSVRHRAQVSLGALASGLPAVARRWRDGVIEEIATIELQPGDEVQVAAGTTIPADGVLLGESAEVDEALLSGESRPVTRRPGDPVLAGSVALNRPLRLRVERLGAATTLSALARMADVAQSEKPESLAVAERVARVFIARILVLSALTGLVWLWWDPGRAFAVALSVLVVSCPCALSLALPTALAAASLRMARLGLLVLRPAALEQLATVRQVVLDKTGTLTDARVQIARVDTMDGVDRSQALALAAALEREAHHPIARAFSGFGEGIELSAARQIPGEGVEGVIAGRRYRLGRATWACTAPSLRESDIVLSCEGRALAGFDLDDRLREDAPQALAQLRALGLTPILLSGDRAPRVRAVADRLAIERWYAEQRPEDKIAQLDRLQALDGPALMVGDGINDAPVLARARVSVAMGQGADLAKAHADLVLLGQRLSALPAAIALARRTVATIRQNLRLSYGYNALAIPVAACGFVPPWLAALGMSLSSLLVVWNSMRLMQSEAVVAPSVVHDQARPLGWAGEAA
jgi:Cu2+-exporting ATPase